MTFFLSISFYVILRCSLATVTDHFYKIQERTEESLYVHIRIYNTIHWNTASIFVIHTYSFLFLLGNHELIIDLFLSVKTWNFEYWWKTLAGFHSLCHGACHNFPHLKRVSITLIWCKQYLNKWLYDYILYIYIYI